LHGSHREESYTFFARLYHPNRVLGARQIPSGESSPAYRWRSSSSGDSKVYSGIDEFLDEPTEKQI
jgi:hypothetical protein